MRLTPLTLLTLLAVAGCTATPAPVPTPAPVTSAASSPSAAAALDYGAFAAGRSQPVKDTVYPKHGNPGLDVLHYGLDLDWSPATRKLTGTATVQVRGAVALSSIQLDFSSAYAIQGVTVDGYPAEADDSADKLTIHKGLDADAYATLVVKYAGTPKPTPMPSHRSDAEPLGLTMTADGSLWTMQEPFGAFTWYPANDQPSDKALYDIDVTVPAGWTAIAGGTPRPRTGDTFHFTSEHPVASYLTTLAVGKYQQETAKGPHGIPLTYWYRPGKDDAAMKIVRKSPQYLSWLEQHFGAYPFATGGVLLVPSASGMETQQMITMGTKFEAGDLLHEYSHHWFGDTVGPTTWSDVWLNEGWAMYAQLLWQAEQEHITDAQLTTWLRATDAKLRKSVGPPGKPPADSFAEGNVYICPAAMLHTIHRQIGDQAFFSLAKDWAQQHRDGTADRAMFIAFVNQHTGRDFTKLITTWLDSPTTPAA
ncbi:M1 family metallopeptidase [Hamadaea tsunoensis]|uniref:M1 family metallopeptidase n=1 Tax=Hamadaea tsunoensis TaxID=53368 RepID=UPI000484B8C9|nr:M1 family metallopeptidase [Hamadaea tsunoensis]